MYICMLVCIVPYAVRIKKCTDESANNSWCRCFIKDKMLPAFILQKRDIIVW